MKGRRTITDSRWACVASSSRQVPSVKKRVAKRESIIAHTKLDPFGSASPWLRDRSNRTRQERGINLSGSVSGGTEGGGTGHSSSSGGGTVAGASSVLSSAASITSSASHSSSPAGSSGGSWRKVTAVLRSHGVLSIYSEDRALLHSTMVSDLATSEIRILDDSIFLRPHVLSVSSRVSTLARPTTMKSSYSATSLTTPTSATMDTSSGRFGIGLPSSAPPSSPAAAAAAAAGSYEPIYLAFPTRRKIERWITTLHVFAVPEIYRSIPLTQAEPSLPRVPAAEPIPSSISLPIEPPRLHRVHRSVHIGIIEARSPSMIEAQAARARQEQRVSFSEHRLAHRGSTTSEDRRSSRSSSSTHHSESVSASHTSGSPAGGDPPCKR